MDIMKQAYLSLGTNLGDRVANLRDALAALAALPTTTITDWSSVYETDPVGYTDQPDFLNMVVAIQTGLSPHALLGACLGIEAALGRKRSFPNAPRIIDMDLLLMEGVTSHHPELMLPHPRMWERAFVLVPLLEIAPSGRVFGLDIQAAARAVDKSGVRFYQKFEKNFP